MIMNVIYHICVLILNAKKMLCNNFYCKASNQVSLFCNMFVLTLKDDYECDLSHLCVNSKCKEDVMQQLLLQSQQY
jgi:hypothetical protein